MSGNGWIGVDLDGTLAHYDIWRGPEHIGDPIRAMCDRVIDWLREGREVRIFTARVYSDGSATREAEVKVTRQFIAEWCEKHLGVVLPITCTKDFSMIELWDDRAVRVKMNEGVPCCGS